jgi:GTPase SAR1 family protein
MANKLNNSNMSNASSMSNTSNKIGVTQAEVKVVFLGMEYCGKTSLIDRFLNDRFTGENSYQVKYQEEERFKGNFCKHGKHKCLLFTD